MDENHLHEPLLPSLANHVSTAETSSIATATADPKSNDVDKVILSNFAVSTRFLFIFLIGIISVWANHEASKGFEITITNNMNTPAGEKFALFYVSNDEATRLVQSSFNFAAKILFYGDDNILEKLVDQIDVQLASQKFTNHHTVSMISFGQKRKYVLSINPLVMEYADFKYRIRREVQKGMAEILLFDQQHTAPKTLLDGMVEYVTELSSSAGPKPVFKSRNPSAQCWEDGGPRVVAKFLAYGEEKSKGFVGRMNQEMNRDGWYEGIMDKILGIPATDLCASFHD